MNHKEVFPQIATLQSVKPDGEAQGRTDPDRSSAPQLANDYETPQQKSQRLARVVEQESERQARLAQWRAEWRAKHGQELQAA